MSDPTEKYAIKRPSKSVLEPEDQSTQEPMSSDIALGTLVRLPNDEVGVVVSFSHGVTTGVIDPYKEPQFFNPKNEEHQPFIDHANLPKCLVLVFKAPLYLQTTQSCTMTMYHVQDLLPFRW